MNKRKDEQGPVDNPFFFQKVQQEIQATGLDIPVAARMAKIKKDEDYTKYLAAIVEYSQDAIISKSMDGTIRSWNKGGEKMFGYTAKQAIGRHISLIAPPGYETEEKDILDRINRNEIIENYETIRCKRGGEQFYVSLTVSPLKDQGGAIIGVSKIARDITVRKKFEAALIQANKTLLVQNLEKEKRAAELTIANAELVFQNEEKEKRAAELVTANKELAFQNEEKEKRAAELVIANKELAFQNEEKEKRAAELTIANTELIFQNEEKEKRAAELVIANKELAFQNEEKEKRTGELVIANRDLRISGEQVEEVNKELESFSYSVSHDLRAPLRGIHGYAKMLKANFETQLDPEANRLMSCITNNAKKMGHLIDDLLTFSRVGRKELVKVNLNMDSIVTNICRELKNELGNRAIEFHFGQILPAYADSISIKQVWLNLISNAIKYSGFKEKIIIEVGSNIKGDEIIYYIKDNGAGFDMRYANKLFGVFQRLHSDEEFEGTGVGLALVQRIITKHGGRTWAEGKVDQGAIFYFTLKMIPS